MLILSIEYYPSLFLKFNLISIECADAQKCYLKLDADFNAAYNISKKIYPLATAIWAYNNSFREVEAEALRCQDDRLKVQMNMTGEKPHASA